MKNLVLYCVIFMLGMISIKCSPTEIEKQQEQAKDQKHKFTQYVVYPKQYDIFEVNDTIDGMRYKILHQLQAGMVVINLTKDSLETSLLRKQLKE